MGWGRRVLPWVGVAVLVLAVAEGSRALRHQSDLTAPVTTPSSSAATTSAVTEAPPVSPWTPPAVQVLRPYAPIHPVFVFPDALDEDTRQRLMTPERDQSGFPNSQVYGWRLDAGGVPSAEVEVDGVRRSMSTHRLVLTNKRHERMRVLDVRAVVLERRPVLDGTLLVDTGLTSPVPDRIRVDLDQQGGRLVDPPSGRPLPDVEDLTAEEGQDVRVLFTAFTSAHHYLWELRWTVQYEGSEPEESVIRSDGTVDGPPFQTAAWGLDRHYSGGIHETHSGPCCYAG